MTRQGCVSHHQATGFQLRPAQPVGDQVSAVMESVPSAVLRTYVLPHLGLADLCRLGCVSRQLRALLALADEAWERMYFDACPVFFQAILLEGKQRDAVCFRTLMAQRCVSPTLLLSTVTVSAGGTWSQHVRAVLLAVGTSTSSSLSSWTTCKSEDKRRKLTMSPAQHIGLCPAPCTCKALPRLQLQ